MKRGLLSQGLGAAALVALLGWLQGGCSTNAFCFDNCEETASQGDAGGAGGTSGAGGSAGTIIVTGGTGGGSQDGGDGGPCQITNGGTEICDGVDNDCNGVIDDGFDLHDKRHCGTCDNNCVSKMINADPDTVTCDWDGTVGQPGTCGFTACSQDWYDINKDPGDGCEYACVKLPGATDDSLCNGRDDDCDGLRDEDVDKCTSVTDCGRCGGACVVLHGTPKCEHPDAGPCDSTNTHCAIASCDDDDNDGHADWWDLDNSYATGCEYHCSLTNGGVEICGDGLDNDCDGKIDGADDDLSGDPQLGQVCYGDPDGVCADPSHAGLTVCKGQKIECQGANVIVQGQVAEICNGLDDDCNGTVDDNLTDVGAPCGTSNIFPCSLGTEQCVNGSLTCVGAVAPGDEYCNGVDDDCDGVIDDNPVDAVGACGQTDVGACELGHKECMGGTVLCVGAVDPKAETCNGLDDDCDGVVDNNPTDVGGTCGQSNTAPCSFGTVQCINGAATCVGAKDPKAEACNGIDDNCDGVIDNGVPGAGVSCGLSDVFPCKKGSMQCQGGVMVCVGAVNPKAETCNGVDDNCNGVIDDNTTDSGGDCGQSNTSPCKYGKLACQNGQLTCVGNVDPSPEICDGKDNDCDGVVDDSPSGINADCGQSNTSPCKYGKTACQNGSIVCVGAVNPKAETCNGVDDDCNGVVDDSPQGAGVSCGQSNVFPCSYGTMQCQSGSLVCVGAVNPKTETCNGVDDDCDGTIDDNPSDATGDCNVPPPPPPGATSPCKKGTKACQGGVVVCQGSVVPAPGAQDTCGVDANCDGVLTNQPNLQTDVHNCGACGNDCLAGAVHANWACVAGSCQFQGCQTGYYDNGGPGDAVAGDHKCGYACTFISAQESCNGVDDNCDGHVDENVTKPSPVQVCGVSPSAVRPECTTGVTVSCISGGWSCTFPAGVCPGGCSANDEICDGLDNDCDGLLNENVANYGQPCASDDGAPGTQGACRTTGTYVCDTTTTTKCSAVAASCTSLPGGCTEVCDGIDNDCDGVVDEPFNSKGPNATYFVKPVVTKVAASLWIYTYEASRPNATTTSPGSGNGYWTSAPSGTTLDKTRACSVGSKVPWFNVTGAEVEQTCAAMGGKVCSTADWQTACRATVPCTWGYNPRTGGACTSGYTSTKYCNLGPSYDFNSSVAGDQDGLLPTASGLLQNCWADWSNLQGNTAATNKLFDITGNLREIVKQGTNDYRLMGGAFNTAAEAGATCSFTFYSVNDTFKFFDTGFRCCFTSDPTN
jgi:hypothetical protein